MRGKGGVGANQRTCTEAGVVRRERRTFASNSKCSCEPGVIGGRWVDIVSRPTKVQLDGRGRKEERKSQIEKSPPESPHRLAGVRGKRDVGRRWGLCLDQYWREGLLWVSFTWKGIPKPVDAHKVSPVLAGAFSSNQRSFCNFTLRTLPSGLTYIYPNNCTRSEKTNSGLEALEGANTAPRGATWRQPGTERRATWVQKR